MAANILHGFDCTFFISGKMRRNFTKNEIVSLEGGSKNAWMCLETIQKCLLKVCLTQKILYYRNIGKNPKAVQKPFGNGEFSASMFWSHQKWLQMSGFNDFSHPPKWCIYVLGFWSSSYLILETELRFPKKKPNFSFKLHTFRQKRYFCQLTAFCKLPITLKRYVLDMSL